MKLSLPLLALIGTVLAPFSLSQSAWNLITPQPTPSPVGRGNAHVTTDGGFLYLFGGRYGSPTVFTPHLSDELWRFDGSAWTQLASGPPAREHAAFTFRPDGAAGKLVVFGGRDVNNAMLGDTWEYDIQAGTWSQFAPAIAPSARRYASIVFSVANGACMMFGGHDGTNYYGETWLWDGAAWSMLAPAVSPSPRARTGIAYDLARNVAVIFGGTSASNVVTPLGPETWEWNGASWQQVTTATSPYTNGARGIISPGFADDAIRERVVMACGAISSSASTGYQNETWEYAGTDWVSRGEDPILEVRGGPGMEFVPALGRTYLFGGFNPNGVFTSNVAFPNMDNRLFEYFSPQVASFMGSSTATGCASTTGAAPAINASSLPWAGETMTVDVLAIPANAPAFLFLGFGTGSIGLGAIGAPGCSVHIASPFAFGMTTSGTAAQLSFGIPNSASLYGAPFYVQGAVVDFGANALGLVVSNRGDAVIGAL